MREFLFVGYSLSSLISIFCLYLILRQRPGEGQKSVQTLTSFICILMTGYWLSLSASSLEGMVIAQKVIYAGGCYVYFYMLLFYLNFCRIRIPRIVSELLQAFSFGMLLVAFTFDHHKLLYRSYSLGEVNGVPILEKEYGIAHHAYIAMMACYCVAFIVLAVHFYRNNKKGKRRTQSLILLLVALCPTASYIRPGAVRAVRQRCADHLSDLRGADLRCNRSGKRLCVFEYGRHGFDRARFGDALPGEQ